MYERNQKSVGLEFADEASMMDMSQLASSSVVKPPMSQRVAMRSLINALACEAPPFL